IVVVKLNNKVLKNSTLHTFLVALLMLSTNSAFAADSASGSSIFNLALWGVAILVIFFLIIQVSDNLIRIEAKEAGIDGKASASMSLFPSLGKLFGPKMPDYTKDVGVHVLSAGHNIVLEGAANKAISDAKATTFAVLPQNFVGISPIPKVTVAVGDEVKAGDEVCFDKKRSEIKYVAPVSGEVIAVNRGAKRSIKEIVILADKEINYKSFSPVDLETTSREELVNFLMESGAWTMIRQRPFNIIPDAGDIPKHIFISTFDTAPLAPNLNFVVKGKGAAFQKGLDVLAKLTPGQVHLGLSANGENPPSTVFTEATGVEKHWFHGKHPAGNVGVQIHHISPIAGNDKVWTLGVQEVITIGKLFVEGKFDASRVVAVTGAEVENPSYVLTYQGAKIGDLVGEVKEGVRLVSGDVLSGAEKSKEEFMDFYDDQITTLKEGDDYEMFGWLAPTTARPSVSQTFLSGLMDITYEANTNTHGEKRAFVVTGQYEKVLPMDIYPQHLMKAILINDFERMEGLGINELVEEDVALCEFACTSKQPLQQILRQGLEVMREQA
ncbi:MAG: Na(+)-translocating NADH-quinone reductase subunit A, partial [Bacteroidota bacterium]